MSVCAATTTKLMPKPMVKVVATAAEIARKIPKQGHATAAIASPDSTTLLFDRPRLKRFTTVVPTISPTPTAELTMP